MNNKKYISVILVILLLSFIILVVSNQVTKVHIEQQKQFLTGLMLFSIILVFLFLVFNFISSFIKKFISWSSAFNTALILYLGILMISLSQYKDLLIDIDWDPSMVSLGIAILAFGWSFVTGHFQEQTIKKNQEKIESNVKKLGRKLSTINRKIDNIGK